MRVVSLFSGCGGLDLGLHNAGHEIILQCECDPGAQQVLRKAFPGTLLVPDICGLQSLPKGTELVAAGFPCIDVSRAGLRQGLEGASTGLVRHVFRLLQQARDDHRPVPWVLLENVEALMDRLHGGPPLVSWVVAQLEALGYSSWAHRVVCSAGFGVPNRRRRIFLLASMTGDARDVLLGQGLQRCVGACLSAVGGDCYECFDPDDDPTTGNKSESAMLRCSYALDLGNARSAAGVDVVPTFTTSNARICLLLSNGRYGALRIEDAERLQGLPGGHTAACWPVSGPGIKQHRGASLRDSEAETQARARFALLGNAVTVQVAQWIGERLADPYRYKYMVTDNDMPLAKEHQPTSLLDSTWQSLREIRLDHLKADGSAGGAAKINRRPFTAAPGSGEDEQAHEEYGGTARVPPEAAAAAGAGGGEAENDGAANTAAAREEGVVGGSGDADGLAVPAPGDEEEGEEPASQAGDQQLQQEEQQQAGKTQEQEGEEEQAADGLEQPDQEMQEEDEEAAAAGAAEEGPATGATAKQSEQLQLQRRTSNARGRPSAGWPRAAWFLAGHGRWGVRDASDSPIKARFLPLGEFIRRVGPPPSDVALVTYLQRLKEQGWNVDRTERKMLMCGVPGLAASGAPPAAGTATGVLEGSNCDTHTAASSIGRLVWAKVRPGSSSGIAAAAAAAGGAVWWPCEAIDPFNPPRGFTLLPEHRLLLPLAERRLHLPADSRGNRAAQPGAGSSAAAEAAAGAGAVGASQEQLQQSVTPAATSGAAAAGSADALSSSDAGNDSSSPDPDTPALPGSASVSAAAEPEAAAPAAVAGGGGECGRKLLLVWFHTSACEWRLEEELLPWAQHKARIKGDVAALVESGRLTRPQEWRRAYREAAHCASILARARKLAARQAQLVGLTGPAAAALAAAELSSSDSDASSDWDEEGEDKGHRAALAGRAAKQALAVNMKMPRCKVCEACTQSTSSGSRRCLLVRATAAAAAGHAGAQLAVLGEKAVGADVEVWWPLDQAWYKGVISAYDSLRVRHTIVYEDGDVEIIPLWAPQQRLKLRSQPAQWVAKAAQLAADRAAAIRDIEAGRAAARVAGAGALPETPPPLTQMEQERAENIQRNKQAMEAFMAGAAAAAAAASPPPATPGLTPAALSLLGGASGAADSPDGSRPSWTRLPDLASFDQPAFAQQSSKAPAKGRSLASNRGSSNSKKKKKTAARAEDSDADPSAEEERTEEQIAAANARAEAAAAAAAANAAAAASFASRKNKRMAASVAVCKIKDQSQVLIATRPQPNKKKKQFNLNSQMAAAMKEDNGGF